MKNEKKRKVETGKKNRGQQYEEIEVETEKRVKTFHRR